MRWIIPNMYNKSSSSAEVTVTSSQKNLAQANSEKVLKTANELRIIFF